MVVLLIMGIALGAVTLAFRAPSQQPLGREGERLSAVLNLAKDEARLTGQPVMLRLDRQGWRFFQAGPEGWVAESEDQLPSGRFNPPLDHVAFGDMEAGDSESVQYFLGIEEIDDFKELTLQRGPQQVRLITDGLGNYRVDRPVP